MTATRVGCTFAIAMLAATLAWAITPEQAAQLFRQYTPDKVRTAFAEQEISQFLENPLGQFTGWSEPRIRYLEFTMPDDPSHYVLLAYGGPEMNGDAYWRLLRSQDGGSTFNPIQDAPLWYSYGGRQGSGNWNIRIADLTGDGVPEMIIHSTGAFDTYSMMVFAWRNGRFESITPPCPWLSPGAMLVAYAPAFATNSRVVADDLDSDGAMEIVVYPSTGWEGTWSNRTTVYLSPTRIYKYDGSAYVLWREVPADDPYPISVPSVAALHPSTLPLSELSNPGNGKLKVFVSHPAGTATVDDMETGQFKYGEAALSFKKRWTNNKQPDTASANLEWGGCPVKQAAKHGQGEWEVNPSDPALPSPDGTMEYHFVGPYLELELSRSAVFPYLLQAAMDALAKEPSRDKYFVEVPLSGKMKNGKLATVSALVCIKKTGAQAPKPVEPIQPSAGAPPAPKEPKGEKAK